MRLRTESKKKLITAAARKCFLRDGYDSSMERIAEEALVSKQTLYSYYPTKEALFVDVVTEIVGNAWTLDSQATTVISTIEDFHVQLKIVATTFVNTLIQRDYLALVRIMIAEAPRQPVLAERFRKHIPERAFQSFAAILQDAQAKDLIQISSPVFTARMLLGGLMTYVLLEGLLAARNTVPANINKEIDEFIDEFLGHISKGNVT